MGLTPEFWEPFTPLLFTAVGLTIVLGALFDAPWLRRCSCRRHKLATERAHGGRRLSAADQVTDDRRFRPSTVSGTRWPLLRVARRAAH
ncbi:hypothetical protein [Streptomyces umbrinus]|uniref:hypothetical protein n=1 Tax=Streptomyces umbrinus TaxID=67370 RepID=UPI0033F6B43F